jgi:hypothetical protein
VIAVLVAFLNVTGLMEVLMVAGSAAIAFAFLSAVHSYMLLVRFSAVDIMRHNVIEI